MKFKCGFQCDPNQVVYGFIMGNGTDGEKTYRVYRETAAHFLHSQLVAASLDELMQVAEKIVFTTAVRNWAKHRKAMERYLATHPKEMQLHLMEENF